MAQARPDTSATSESGTAKASALDAPLLYQILLGELSARDQQPGEAFSIMFDAASKTHDPALYRRTVQIALQARSGESALQAAKAWSQVLPASREANHFVLQILLALNRVTDTLEPLTKELALTPAADRVELIWSIPGLYERAHDKPAVVTVVQKALTQSLKQPDHAATAWAAMGRLWQSAGKTQQALDAAQKAQAINLRSEHPALLALSLMTEGTPQAQALIGKHLPYARPEFRMAYVKTLVNAKREEDAMAQLLEMQVRAADYADTWLVSGALALQRGQLELAEQHLQRYLTMTQLAASGKVTAEIRRGRSQAFLAMAQISQLRKNLGDAQRWLEKVDNPDDLLRAQLRRASMIAQEGRLDQAVELIRSQPERSEADARLKRSAEVQLLREQHQLSRARATLQAFIAQFPDESDLLYDLAMVYEKLGDLPEMERLLRELIASRPDDPHPYNALGYSLADRGLRLPEAIALITKALELTPKDPFITDSLAWAHFRSGNKNEAQRLLQQAFRDRPDAEIAAHLGEVLWDSDQRSEAIDVFRRGVALSPDNDTLKETIRRLRVPL
ncbi:MAG: tetratricopeptide repeat protein [Rhodoferax sp.]|nr:tetratricopeptide repeat protein [Rhodoferax sp.]